jgi:hypothetical protein
MLILKLCRTAHKFLGPIPNFFRSYNGISFHFGVTVEFSDSSRLELAHQLAERLITRSGKRWSVRASTERRDLLAGSDFIINTIEVAGLTNVRHDFDIPMKYGVNQCIGDTIGPGGIFKALRTGPAWLDILHDAERLCPQAWVLNYTNPMSILTLAALAGTTMRTVGPVPQRPGNLKAAGKLSERAIRGIRMALCWY